ncbi:hypothetical protein [Hymenobacter glacieicola]|uniref:Uncharacterized protein n=1 Tax=Hymenobacter glacieicola TaxID=1562124 RepID=A0ABQ1WJU6_9BACT|nr:hypothetical protein [Hymenobacter glacieicola]GGG33492.1 hypothetical protein GCM10011378_07450 [Hymenobacter glacieicola]
MPHGFRITGQRYLGKGGQANDSSTGTNPEFPARTPGRIIEAASGARETCIVGSGSYIWAPSATALSSVISWRADTTVKFLGDASTRFYGLCRADSTFEGIYFDQFAGFNFRDYQFSNQATYRRCIFKVLPEFGAEANSSSKNPVVFKDCIFFNLFYTPTGDILPQFDNCLFFDSTVTAAGIMTRCYGYNSRLTATTVDTCAVDIANGVGSGYGFRTGAGASFDNLPSGTLRLDPKFNRREFEDYTLRADSPLLASAIGPTHLGYSGSQYFQYQGALGTITTTNTKLVSAANNTPTALSSVTGNLMVNSQGGVIVQPGASSIEGVVFTDPIAFSDRPEILFGMDLVSGLNFDNDFQSTSYQMPDPRNNNVPSFDEPAYGPGTAGRNPRRLTYLLLWSTLPTYPDKNNPAHWVTGTNYVEMEWGTQPKWNGNASAPVGNGRADFNPATMQSTVLMTYYRIGIKQSNYNPQ